MPPADALAMEIRTVWGVKPFYLDASQVPPNSSGKHPLTELDEAARLLKLKMIPATYLGARPEYQSAVHSLNLLDGRGIALRVDLHKFATAGAWAPNWPAPLGKVDLIADFAANVSAVHALGAGLDPVLKLLHEGAQWRSVTLMGTSMPENFAGYKAGPQEIPRREWELWQRVSSMGLHYHVDYGDYTTVPVIPPPEGIRYGFPINVRYTLSKSFLICRGVRTRGPEAEEMDAQLQKHAKAIVAYPTRGKLARCWADATIDDIASDEASPANLPIWVRYSVNRHIELVRYMLP